MRKRSLTFIESTASSIIGSACLNQSMLLKHMNKSSINTMECTCHSCSSPDSICDSFYFDENDLAPFKECGDSICSTSSSPALNQSFKTMNASDINSSDSICASDNRIPSMSCNNKAANRINGGDEQQQIKIHNDATTTTSMKMMVMKQQSCASPVLINAVSSLSLSPTYDSLTTADQMSVNLSPKKRQKLPPVPLFNDKSKKQSKQASPVVGELDDGINKSSASEDDIAPLSLNENFQIATKNALI